MPANLPPQYLEAEKRYREGRSDEEKLAALEDMYALLPKHKGTDKVQADIRRRLSQLRKKGHHRPFAVRGDPYKVVKEGAGQVILIGPPNSGKSSVVSALSGVSLGSAPYPFTTRIPQVAMMSYLDIKVQLVDLPPITGDFCTYWQINLARSADLILIVIDMGHKDVFEQLEGLSGELSKRRIRLGSPPEEPAEGVVCQRFLLLGNKMDLELARNNLEILPEFVPAALSLYPFSAIETPPEEVEKLKATIWEKLDLIRIYSKPVRGKADMKNPYTLPGGSTVMDFAAKVHKDFANKFEGARLWGSGKFPGQTVGREHVLQDGDVVELHLKD